MFVTMQTPTTLHRIVIYFYSESCAGALLLRRDESLLQKCYWVILIFYSVGF
jgi:hypothetical protein